MKTIKIIQTRRLFCQTDSFKLLLLMILMSIPVFAQENTGVGYHGATFLRIHPSARFVGMGEAGTALSDDINLLRAGIGGMGIIRNTMLAANFHNWIDDTQQGSIALAFAGRLGVVGFDLSYFNEGKIEILDEFFRKTGGTVHSDDILFSIGYGNHFSLLGQTLSAGAGIKMLRQTLAGEQSSAYGLDVGALFRTKYLNLSVNLQNLGLSQPKFKTMESPLPLSYRGGIGTQFHFSDALLFGLAGDALWVTKEKMRYSIGSELIISQLFAFRGGYRINKVEVSPWSFGFGLYIPMAWLAGSQTRFDYAYSPLDPFESTAHRFSLIFTFGIDRSSQELMALRTTEQSAAMDEMNERLKRELEAAERARLSLQEAEARAKLLEQEMAERLAQIRRIAAESEGKIEVEPQDAKRILVSMRINFDFDQARIRPDEYKTMDQVGDILNTYPEAKVHVSGHTDDIGTEEYNIRLSQRRIDSVMVYLAKKKNVSANRFYMPIGYGELKPIASNATADGRFRNRRVEFLLFTYDAVPEIPEGSAIKNLKIIDDHTFEIECNGKVKVEKMTLNKPERLIIDFPGIYLLTEATTFEINRGAIIRARLGFHPETRFSRVVFDLSRPISAEIQTKDNIVTVKVK